MSTLTATDYVFEIATQEIAPLAPFEIWEVPLDGGSVIRFFEPLVLQPFWLEDDSDDPDEDEYLAVERPDLDFSAWGRNRKELWNCICGDIRETWECFVQVPDSRLSERGKKIKRAYLAIAEEVSDG